MWFWDLLGNVIGYGLIVGALIYVVVVPIAWLAMCLHGKTLWGMPWRDAVMLVVLALIFAIVIAGAGVSAVQP